MTTSQSFQIYEILFRYFKSETDAKSIVTEIERVIESNFITEKEHLATKSDIAEVKIELKETKAGLLKWMIILFTPFYVGMIVFLVKQFM